MDYHGFREILVYQYKFGELPYELINEELLIRGAEYPDFVFCLYDDIDVGERFWVDVDVLDKAIDEVISNSYTNLC